MSTGRQRTRDDEVSAGDDGAEPPASSRAANVTV
jgi:hypothetical protein